MGVLSRGLARTGKIDRLNRFGRASQRPRRVGSTEPLTERGLNMARAEERDARALALDVLARHDAENGTALVSAHQAWLVDVQRTAFDSGFGMAARIEQEHAKAELAQYVLRVLGKDSADGVINLGTNLGEWAVTTTDATAVRL